MKTKDKPAKAAPAPTRRHDPQVTAANRERRIAKDKALKARAQARRATLPAKQLKALVESPNFDPRWVPNAAAVIAAYYGDGPNPFESPWVRLMQRFGVQRRRAGMVLLDGREAARDPGRSAK